MNQRRDGQINPLNDPYTHHVLKIIEGRWGRHVEEVISIKIEQFYQKRLIGNCWRYQPADMYLLEVTFSPDNELFREQFSLNQP